VKYLVDSMKDPPKRVYRLALPSEEGVQIGAWRSQPDAATSTTLVGGMRTALRTASQHRTPARLFCINSLSEARHLSTYYERGMSATQSKGKRFVRKESVPPNVALSVVAEAVSSACVLMGLPAKVYRHLKTRGISVMYSQVYPAVVTRVAHKSCGYGSSEGALTV
jgi:hypothetical protein